MPLFGAWQRIIMAQVVPIDFGIYPVAGFIALWEFIATILVARNKRYKMKPVTMQFLTQKDR
jgi:hypothetical protein